MIDAAGRGSRTPVWLPELGLDAPRTTRVRAGVTYVSRLYRRDQKQLDGRFGSLVTPYPGRPFGGAVLRQEGDRWVVLLAGMVGTEPPLDEDGMIAFADQFACGDIAAVHAGVGAADRAAEVHLPGVGQEPLRETWRPPGRAACHRRRVLQLQPDLRPGHHDRRARGADPARPAQRQRQARHKAAPPRSGTERAGLARDYFQAAGKLVAEAWETSASSDLRFPEVEGKRRRGAALINAYGEKFRAAASVDPALGETFLRVANMVDKPAKLLSPGTVLRVFRSAGKAVRAGRDE